MRCFLSFWSNFLVSLSLFSWLVHGLQITIEEGDGGILVDKPTSVRWTHEPNDPLDFDFRFVVGQFNDVGLARANIVVDQPVGDSGQVPVTFSMPGRFVIKAVSGPQFVVIGTSNEVEVKRPTPPVPTSASASPSSASSSVTSRTSAPTASQSANGTANADTPRTSPSTRSGVIAGIVIGTTALFLIIGLLIFFWLRRRQRTTKDVDDHRVSFHPDQMVQRPRSRFMSIGRFTFRTTASSPVDAEQAVGTITPFPPPLPLPSSAATLAPPTSQFTNPFTTPGEPVMRPLPTPPPPSPAPEGGHLRPLPSLPPHSPTLTQHRDRVAPHQRALPAAPRTERQQQLSSRLTQVKDQIRVLKRNSVGLDRVMEDLQKQVHWLEAQSESDWALGLTDVPPPGFARYMTP